MGCVCFDKEEFCSLPMISSSLDLKDSVCSNCKKVGHLSIECAELFPGRPAKMNPPQESKSQNYPRHEDKSWNVLRLMMNPCSWRTWLLDVNVYASYSDLNTSSISQVSYLNNQILQQGIKCWYSSPACDSSIQVDQLFRFISQNTVSEGIVRNVRGIKNPFLAQRQHMVNGF